MKEGLRILVGTGEKTGTIQHKHCSQTGDPEPQHQRASSKNRGQVFISVSSTGLRGKWRHALTDMTRCQLLKNFQFIVKLYIWNALMWQCWIITKVSHCPLSVSILPLQTSDRLFLGQHWLTEYFWRYWITFPKKIQTGGYLEFNILSYLGFNTHFLSCQDIDRCS